MMILLLEREFVAVDGPISDEGMSYARGCSTRAEVSRYRWRNVYNWGNFHGDPIELLQYYDTDSDSPTRQAD
jgi:hypothetical protein